MDARLSLQQHPGFVPWPSVVGAEPVSIEEVMRSIIIASLLALGCATTNPSQRVADHLYFCAHYLGRGLLDQAEARCELALELDRSSAHAYNLLGLVERARGNLDQAARHFKKAIALDELPEVFNNYGEIFVDRHEWAEARDLFAQALEIDPTYVNARANFAKALYYTDDQARAAKEYLKCTEQNPEHCECRLGLGVIAVSRGDSGSAIDNFERLTQICPRGAMGHYNLCWAYFGVRRCSEAVSACSEAVKIDPDYLEAQQAQARAAECVAEQEATLRVIMAQVEAQPKDPAGHYELGCLLEARGRWAEALESFNRCLRLAPGHVRAHFHAARTSDRLLDAGATVAHCEDFLERARGEDVGDEKAWCVNRVRELR